MACSWIPCITCRGHTFVSQQVHHIIQSWSRSSTTHLASGSLKARRRYTGRWIVARSCVVPCYLETSSDFTHLVSVYRHDATHVLIHLAVRGCQAGGKMKVRARGRCGHGAWMPLAHAGIRMASTSTFPCLDVLLRCAIRGTSALHQPETSVCGR